ncbi:MAG: cytidylate kinase-like family protein [Proteobacteria bacterium]|nr:cytidylate kinase-like family protein [Pseudomonadota bacterium]MBU1586200.1 cytidylate kinase-like family protein [Pseudomonadota bacterium]MBU2453997.1 cytidylate kinase-like family protein [Pseudomonadota bacterium]MBU2630144.1 cytidylate kinase-like family protein [Pseudomonadota bacterium]
MTIVTISRGTYSRGKEIAEKLATALGYECLSREIVIEASKEFNIPEIKLIRAIHDAPSVLDRFTYGKERYLAFFRSALLKHLQRDNIIYHGLAGHAFLQEIPHVFKVRIIADLDFRIGEEMKREKISADQARHILVKDDAERRKWSLTLYGLDIWNPQFYDMTLHLDTMDVEEAVSIILHTIQHPCFQTTPKSCEKLNDLSLNAQVEAALIHDFPKAKADSRKGIVFVSIRGSLIDEKNIFSKVNCIIEKIKDVKKIHINIVPYNIES